MTTNPQTTVTYTLEEVLARFEQNVNKQFAEVNQKSVVYFNLREMG